MSKQSSFINIDSMHQYVTYDYSFIDYDSNLKEIGVKQFTWQNCIRMFQSNEFLQTHTIERNQQMIEYFYQINSSKIDRDNDINIEQIPFLMDQNNCLQSMKNIYFPQEIIPDYQSNISFLNQNIFKWLNENKQIKEWLEKFGIKQLTDSIYLNEIIIFNPSTYITSENAIKTIKFLFKSFEKILIGKKELNCLKQLKLLTTHGTLIAAEQCFFSDQYKPLLTLEEYLKTKEDKFLSFDYITKGEKVDLFEWRRFFMMIGVQEELRVIEFPQKLKNDEAIEYGFHQKYLSTIFGGYYHINAYSGLKTITFLEHTTNNYEFAKFFWSYVIKNMTLDEWKQNTKIYCGASHKPSAINGIQRPNTDYVEWFVKNIRCLPTTFNTCQSSSDIFVDSEEMRELCGEYMPFPSILLSDWHRVFNFKTKLSINDYLNLLEKIRSDEKNLNNNLDRIQLIYSYILKDIDLYSTCENEVIKSQETVLYLLSENNQWKLANELHIYADASGINTHLNDIISCLKLDFKNRNHPQLHKFLDLFNIKQIQMKDLLFDHENSLPARQFQEKLIQISPYLKKWLKLLSIPPDVISTIDKILIQQEIQFIESDSLKFSFKEKFVHETNVYHDVVHRIFYLTRPWNSETTFIDLPNHLCRLLHIQGFEDKLRFLLKAENEEIIKHFTKHSIEKPTEKDFIILQSSSNEPTTRQKKNSNDSLDLKKTNSKSSLLVDSNLRYNLSMHHVDHGWVQCSVKESNDDKNIQIIDLSDIITTTPDFESLKSTIGGNDDLHKRLIGGIGEQMVYQYLQKKYSSSTNSVSIQWENENDESNLPYDISLIKNREKHYIEVKSTRINDENSFQLSINQIQSIIQYRQYYHIYRVYTEKKKLIIFDNVQQCLQKQHLFCFFRY